MTHAFFIACGNVEEMTSYVSQHLVQHGIKAMKILVSAKRDDELPHEWIVRAFRQTVADIEGLIEQAGGAREMRNTLAIVHLNDPALSSLGELNPISTEGGTWSAVVAMLVLAFPETHWCFSTGYDPLDSFLFEKAHMLDADDIKAGIDRILEFREKRFSPLFDPTGLRSHIRSRIGNEVQERQKHGAGKPKPIAPYVPMRPRLAAALDEEESYAYLNAYAAYRFGFRAHVITSYGMMHEVLGGDARRPALGAAGDNHISLIFEDLYLGFPDKDPELLSPISDLMTRDGLFRELPEIEQRILVTVGHQNREEDQAIWTTNHAYLQTRRRRGKYCRTIYKPGSGLFDIWNHSGLRQRLRRTGGRAAGFVWPPEKSSAAEAQGGHSAPGRLLLVSTCLVERAGRIMSSAKSVPETIHGAVLALEALEYLGHRTPTASLEALALKHKLEVLAECMFYGVEYNMDVKSRFMEIEREVASIGGWFKPSTRKPSRLNAEIRIVSELMSLFREHSQFDEEQKSLARIRGLHRRLWFRRNKMWAWLLYPARWYVEFLLGSVLRFVLAILLWIVVLTLIYGIVLYPHPDQPYLNSLSLLHGLSDAVTAFLGMQPPHDLRALVQEHSPAGGGHEELIVIITIVAILASFVHLGIFVSHLYSILARR